ncbi:MAG: hypothetical protein ACPG3U_04500 [Rhodothermales bacterium]
MNEWIRRTGFALVILGFLITASWFIDPLWEVVSHYRLLPVPLQLGIAIAAIGLTVLMISLIAERWADREADAALREDAPHPPSS